MRLVDIRRHIDVAHRYESQKFGLVNELVEKNDIRLNIKFADPPGQTLSINLAFTLQKLGMGRAEHDVQGVGAPLED